MINDQIIDLNFLPNVPAVSMLPMKHDNTSFHLVEVETKLQLPWISAKQDRWEQLLTEIKFYWNRIERYISWPVRFFFLSYHRSRLNAPIKAPSMSSLIFAALVDLRSCLICTLYYESCASTGPAITLITPWNLELSELHITLELRGQHTLEMLLYVYILFICRIALNMVEYLIFVNCTIVLAWRTKTSKWEEVRWKAESWEQ